MGNSPFKAARPRAEDLTLNGLTHRVYRWGSTKNQPSILLLHGFLDNARAFDLLAASLLNSRPELSIISMDWRGHGQSQWTPPGSYYYFPDYVRDLDCLLMSLGDRPIHALGHSMGGGVALYYGGARPTQFRTITYCESLLVPDSPLSEAPHRMGKWLDALRGDPRASRRVSPDLKTIAGRLRFGMGQASPEVLDYLATHASEVYEGGYALRFDPLHRTRSPYPFYRKQAEGFWKNLSCPVLSLEGALTTFQIEDMPQRTRCFSNLTVKTIPQAGHGMHVENPDAVAEAFLQFTGL